MWDKTIELQDGIQVCNELEEIIKNSKEEVDFNKQLTEFLAKREKFVQGTFLNYTSLPDSKATGLSCRIAQYLSKQDKGKASALSFLMPTIKYTANRVSFEDITEKPLSQIIQSHIMSDDNQSLIPVGLLSELRLEDELNAVLFNPFIFSSDGKKPKLLSENEKQRIIHHSPSTEEIVSSKEDYVKTASENPSLYTEILELIKGLRAGGEHGLRGGTAGAAGKDAEIAIKKFNKYWDFLSEAQKEEARKIEGFKKEIEDTICNPLWGGQCVEEQAKALDSLVLKNREALTNIALDTGQSSKLLQTYSTTFEKAKKELRDPNYQGQDKLFLSVDQVNLFIKKENVTTRPLLSSNKYF